MTEAEQVCGDGWRAAQPAKPQEGKTQKTLTLAPASTKEMKLRKDGET